MNDLTADKLYYVKKKNGDVCMRQAHLFSTLKTENAMLFVDFDDDDILAVLAPVPTYDQFPRLVKKVEKLEKQLKEANKILFNVWDCREDREYYAELAKSYFEKYGVEK